MVIHSADAVLPCVDLDATQRFLVERLGFRLRSIWPADAPRVAVVEGFGARLQLRLDAGATGGALHLCVDEAFARAAGAADGALLGPGGLRVEFAPERAAPLLPPLPTAPQVVVARAAEGRWQQGRAGMRYLDLLPGRFGGRCIASRIRIDEGGPVPDYVHYHRIAAQLLFCVRGAIDVVYEDQGPPLQLRPGDALLQPPTIRHRVLACTAGAEVIELASPAEHETLVDHELALPNERIDPGRTFGGQRFVHARVDAAQWAVVDGGSVRELGIAAATAGAVRARVVRGGVAVALPEAAAPSVRFLGVLRGAGTITGCDGAPTPLTAGDAWATTAPAAPRWTGATPDLEFLEVELA
ncbi:MAG: cupin [Planctomycetota bacterium]